VEKGSTLLRHSTPSIEGSLSRPGSHEEQTIFSVRCEYTLEEGNVYGVVSGAHQVFTRYEDEQIHSPGVIRSHGMLVSLQRVEGPKLNTLPASSTRIRTPSANTLSQAYLLWTAFSKSFRFISGPIPFPCTYNLEQICRYLPIGRPKSLLDISFIDPCGYLIPC